MTQKHDKAKSIFKEFAFEIFAGMFAVFAVLLFWDKPVFAFLMLAVGLGMQLFFWKEKLDATVMIFAAIVGAPAEVFCVKSGLWSYHAPGLFFGVPVWLPLVWAYLICLFHRFSLTTHEALHRISSNPDNVGLKLLYWMLGLIIIAYYAVAVSVIAKTFAISFTLFMIPVAILRHSRKDILLFITGAIFGTLGEYVCMKLGFWHYHNPHFKTIGLPMSLPMAWGLSSIIIVGIAGKCVKK